MTVYSHCILRRSFFLISFFKVLVIWMISAMKIYGKENTVLFNLFYVYFVNGS